jgi:acyl-CoA synthetase (AMP-forming)/AMP-acid ligase II
VRNLAELILDRAARRPEARFGTVGAAAAGTSSRLGDAVALARTVAGGLLDAGVGPGSRVAVLGESSDAYLVSWLALQLLGAEAALVNPAYPDELVAAMLTDLEPDAVATAGRPVPAGSTVALVDLDRAADGEVRAGGRTIRSHPIDTVPGLDRAPLDLAGYMHTSGTTGTPKFCAQTHEYFLRLGRFIADSLCLSAVDTVFAPLPLFHINPLGYGVIGGLTAGADVLAATRFSASGFWPTVRDHGVTALILHAPPVEILKRATTSADAAGHRVRVAFYADADFLEEFGVPLAVSAYGSTEAGGLCHVWHWRAGDRPSLPEGMSRYGGRARHDVTWRVDADGEIHVKGERPGVLFSGYRRGADLVPALDEAGWFATGDLGRVDDAGNLVFIERRAESIRVKGEYVPIGYVEQRFAAVPGIDDLAVWRRTSDLVDDEVVLHVVGEPVPLDELRAVAATLPPFMRPSCIVRVAEIPRDSGVGKVRRRQLSTVATLEVVEL